MDISALACATPTDFLNCGSTSTVTSTGTEKLKNLAVGDVFSTYDYVVSVTEVSGSESTGWTGRGYIEMSFLKLGATALSVPLAVRFNNIHLNQCYQLLPGSKVITEFDPTWSNMADLDIIADQVSILYTEIKDLLATKPDNKEVLQAKLDELQTLKDGLASLGLQADYITEQTAALTSVIDAGTCYVGLPGARTTNNSCSAPDFVAAVAGAEQILAKIVPSVYLSKINLSLNSSFAHGLADGIIDASPVGVVKFAWEVATDQEVRDALVQGVQALAADPAGVVKDIVTEKYDSWKNVLHGEGTEQQKYNVGKDLGNVIGALITAAGIIKLGNYINGRANVKQLKELVPPKRVGHTTTWSEMTQAERRTFQHSYSRHSSELGFPNWSQSKISELQELFNDAVSNIKDAGINKFFKSEELINGVRTKVKRTKPIINGQKYYCYETLEGKFISAGKMP